MRLLVLQRNLESTLVRAQLQHGALAAPAPFHLPCSVEGHLLHSNSVQETTMRQLIHFTRLSNELQRGARTAPFHLPFHTHTPHALPCPLHLLLLGLVLSLPLVLLRGLESAQLHRGTRAAPARFHLPCSVYGHCSSFSVCLPFHTHSPATWNGM